MRSVQFFGGLFVPAVSSSFEAFGSEPAEASTEIVAAYHGMLP